MLDRLTHRGPDDAGSKTLGHGWLGHTRLSIVDLSHGRQPLINADGNAWLVERTGQAGAGLGATLAELAPRLP